jgi:2-polyprenyl-3-methyl-5-hydroxy-6-metoxy-1,4-benzoquinol methylase
MKHNDISNDDRERLEREREFHNQRYTDDELRSRSVDKFYEVASAFHARYRDRVLLGAACGKVLEYGVGTGSYAFALAQQGASVTGIDISETAVAVAKREACNRGLEIDFQVMNAEETSFEDGSFDLICGTGILHHLNLGKAIPEIRRLLTPGGVALFLEPLGHNVLINQFRRRTPAIRTADEHPLLKDDLRLMGSYFKKCETEYFGLVSLAAAFAPPLRHNLRLRRFLEAIDRLILSAPIVRLQAWLVLIELAGGEPVLNSVKRKVPV